MWLCIFKLFSCKSQRWLNRDNLETTFFLRCSFCYPKPVKSSVLKNKMEVLNFNRQLRCCNAYLAREIVPGHGTNLILFVSSTAFMYFPFFSWNTFLYPGHRDPTFCEFPNLPNICHFWSAAKDSLLNYLQNFNSFLMKQQLTLKHVTN